jgi:hypothetical protein
MQIQAHINDTVWVKLSGYGADVYNKHNNSLSAPARRKRVSEGEVVEMPFRTLIKIFGEDPSDFLCPFADESIHFTPLR